MQEWPLTVLVILLAFEFFVIAPVAQKTGVPLTVQGVIAAAVFAAMVATVWRNRIALGAVLLGTATEIAAIVLRYVRPTEVTEVLDFSATVTIAVALTVVLAFAVFGPGEVTIHRILGAIAIYLSVAGSFAFAYRVINALVPGAFLMQHPVVNDHPIGTFVYFSFTTLTTSGYGDIVAVDPIARSLTNLEAVFGQLYPATILARLITLEVALRSRGS